MRVLVVGGAGYIGSHMVKALLEAGHDVITFDDLSTGHREAVLGGRFLLGSLAQPESLDHAFFAGPVDAVMHFASSIAVGESVVEPAKYYRNNVAGTLNLIDAMRRHVVGKLVFSSTAAVYGDPQYSPIDEAHPKAPINPYGKSKWMVEQVLEDYGRAYGMRSASLRYFNAAGADPGGRIGERHDPETHLIPIVLQAVSGRRESVTIFGRDYDTPDGTCIRDYIHVEDLCQAHLLALDYLAAGGPTAAFNLGNGAGFSVKEVVDTAARVTGRPVEARYGERRPGDAARLVADPARAVRELRWQPRRGDLAGIIADAWAWEQRIAVPAHARSS